MGNETNYLYDGVYISAPAHEDCCVHQQFTSCSLDLFPSTTASALSDVHIPHESSQNGGSCKDGLKCFGSH